MKFRADDPELERLSNRLLDAAYEPSARDIAKMCGKLSAKGLAQVGGEAGAEKLRQEEMTRDEAYERYISKRFRRGRIAQAVENGDHKTALALAGDNPELL